MISRYGYDVVGTVLVLSVLGTALASLFVDVRIVRFGIIGVLVFLLLFTLYFFRDPDRTPPKGDNLVVAPADGEVVAISQVREEEYIKKDAIQVSIFMSPLNVHVNRYPISGTVGFYRYIPGEYIMAFEEKSSARNERTLIGIENTRCRVLFRQVAGFIARRIVANVSVGDRAVAGERFGMIKFGSRGDVIVPREAGISVKLGEKTVGGETVLAVIP